MSLTQTLSSLCMSARHPSQAQSTLYNHQSTHLRLPLLFLLSVAGWWLFYYYRYFIPPCESQNVRSHYQKCHIFWLGIPARHLKYQTDTGTGLFKTHKTRTVLENKEEWVPEVLPWKNRNEESRGQCMNMTTGFHRGSSLKWVEQYLHSPMCLNGLLRNSFSFMFYGERGCETCCCVFQKRDLHTSICFLPAC